MMRGKWEESCRRSATLENETSVGFDCIAEKQARSRKAIQEHVWRTHVVRRQSLEETILLATEARGVHLAFASVKHRTNVSFPSADDTCQSFESWYSHDSLS